MGVVNVTPDSFSDDGLNGRIGDNTREALARCERLLSDGAHILDIGGESTRPGATPLSLKEELARVMPVVTEAVKFGVPISVDTYKPQVMQSVLDCGVDIINCVWAFRQAGADEVVRAHGRCGLVVMHMHGEPESMQVQPMVGEVVAEILSFLEQRIQWILGPDGDLSRICIDSGIGFGKTVAQNFELLRNQSRFSAMGGSVLAGWSRKSSLGTVTGLGVADRLIPSVAAAVLAVERGAHVVRVHDVLETSQALKVWLAAR